VPTAPHTIRLLDRAAVRQALPMKDAVAAMKRAFAALAAKRAIAPTRIHLDLEKNRGVSLVMPAYVEDDEGEALAVKVVSLFEGNQARGLARIQAAVLAFEPDTGRPLALLEGATLTAIRTGAVCGAATDLLARPDSTRVALLGAGVQARTTLEAVCTVRDVKQVRVFSPTRASVEQLIADVADVACIPADIQPAASPRDALADADIICCATTSHTPVFDDADLPQLPPGAGAGAHINALGSYQPHVVEVPRETILRALVVVDDRESALSETGDLIQPIEAGDYSADRIHSDLGELVLGQKPGRTSADQLTLFKSVGVAVQDAAAAQITLANAKRDSIGVEIPWG